MLRNILEGILIEPRLYLVYLLFTQKMENGNSCDSLCVLQ